MNVKGVIIEDEQGREFVLMCEQPSGRGGRIFSLRGWQRRRLVPLQYTELERRKIVGGVLATLNDLFRSLPRLVEHLPGVSPDNAGSATPLVGLRNPPPTQKVEWSGGSVGMSAKQLNTRIYFSSER
jgi:hypothetical protein